LNSSRLGQHQGQQNAAAMMDTGNIDKKLREAKFFLDKMIDHEQRAFGEREPFDFYLSAFLGATRTVDYRLRHEQGATYKPWRTKWDANLTPAQQTLIKFMVDDRNVEVHGSGSGRGQKTDEIEVRDSYSDKSGTLQVFSVPAPLTGIAEPPAKIYKPAYSFTIDGNDRKATEACREYIDLLAQMVDQFKAAHP